MMDKLGYFIDKVNVRLLGEEPTLSPKKDEVVVYKSFFKARHQPPMYQLIAKILQRYELYMHQLTPNAIVRLLVFIWAIRSQGGHIEVDAFYKIHDLHYQTKTKDQMKAKSLDNLHNNFICYNFMYRKDIVALVLAYRMMWHEDQSKEWFYAEVDSKNCEEFKGMLMSPLNNSFGLKSPKCEMNEDAEECYKAFNTVFKKIGS